MRLFLAFICLALLWTNGLPWLAVSLLATAAILAALSWALSPLVRWMLSE
jgi:hypothetical protein